MCSIRLVKQKVATQTSKKLSRPLLITIYTSFIRSHLDCGDILYNQAYNVSFHQKMKFIHYNVALAITESISR